MKKRKRDRILSAAEGIAWEKLVLVVIVGVLCLYVYFSGDRGLLGGIG